MVFSLNMGGGLYLVVSSIFKEFNVGCELELLKCWSPEQSEILIAFNCAYLFLSTFIHTLSIGTLRCLFSDFIWFELRCLIRGRKSGGRRGDDRGFSVPVLILSFGISLYSGCTFRFGSSGRGGDTTDESTLTASPLRASTTSFQ